MYQKPSNGAGNEEAIAAGSEGRAPTRLGHATAAGLRALTFQRAQTLTDISIVPVSGDGKPVPFMATRFNEGFGGLLALDGRWVAYASDESRPGRPGGGNVAPFPGPGGKRFDLGCSWRRFTLRERDGKEIFFSERVDGASGASVAVNGSEGAFEVGEAQVLFALRPRAVPGQRSWLFPQFDVSADGQRFLVNRVISEGPVSASFTLCVNWPALLTK